MPRAALRTRDLLAEAVAGILQRPGRTCLTSLGVILGVGVLVAVLGIAATASGQVSERFTALVATEVTVEEVPDPHGLRDELLFPADAEDRVRHLNGVVDAGVFWEVPGSTIDSVTGVPLPGVRADSYLPVVAASPGLFPAVHATVEPGRPYDQLLERRGERTAVVGSSAAAQLGITGLDPPPVVFVDGVAFTVIGVLNDVERNPELLSAVLLPRATVEGLWGPEYHPDHPPRMLIDTELGAAPVVADQAALALRPDVAEELQVTAPPNPRDLRDQVSSDLSTLFLLLAVVSLIIGAAGIANTMVVAVLERTSEIGLRRALGARRRHIAAQFLVESAAIGALGGLIGTGLGVVCVILVAVAQQWTPVMEPAVVLVAPLLGSVAGLGSGAYPAVRAARTEPADAVR